MRIVFPDATEQMAACYDEAARSRLPALEVHIGKPSPEAFVERVSNADGIIAFQTKITDAMMAGCPRLRDISMLSTGYAGWVDLAAAERRGMRVQGVRGYGDRTVAEHALALMFACMRKIPIMDRGIRAGRWHPEAIGELAGKIVAVIGLGGIGRTFAGLVQALGMTAVAWNRSPVADFPPARLMALDDALAAADVVSLHLALTPETCRLFDGARLDRMRPGAIFINTARGALVDENALAARLASGRIAAAGLDVFAAEPIAPDHPLLAFESVVVTAHAGWLGPEAARRLLMLGIENLERTRT